MVKIVVIVKIVMSVYFVSSTAIFFLYRCRLLGGTFVLESVVISTSFSKNSGMLHNPFAGVLDLLHTL